MCVTELPVMSRMPYVRMRNGTSITVWWREWRNPPDQGTGPVSAYVVYYRQHGADDSDDWEAVQQTRSKMAVVTGLHQDTEYVFRVAAVHQIGAVGLPSPILTVSTCGSMYHRQS